MVTYSHDSAPIQESTAKALLSKRGILLDTVTRVATLRNKELKVTILTHEHETVLYIANTMIDAELGKLIDLVCVRYNDNPTQHNRYKFAVTYAAKEWYAKKEDFRASSREVLYRDWIVPSPRKLFQILTAIL